MNITIQLDALISPEECNLIHVNNLPEEQKAHIDEFHGITEYLPLFQEDVDYVQMSTYAYKDARILHLRCIANRDNFLVLDVCLREPIHFMRLCADLFNTNKVQVIVAAISLNETDNDETKPPELMTKFTAFYDKYKDKMPYNMLIDPTSFKVVVIRKFARKTPPNVAITVDCNVCYNNSYVKDIPTTMFLSTSPTQQVINARFNPPLILPVKSAMNIYDHCTPHLLAKAPVFDLNFETPYGDVKPFEFQDMMTSKLGFLCPLGTYSIIYGVSIPKNTPSSNPVVENIRLNVLGHESAATKIQDAWRRAISDPSYAVCRKRLMSEFNEVNATMMGM